MKNSNKTRLSIQAIAVALLLAGHAQAHHVWIEQDAKEAKLYFGEFGDNLRESSPGLLDRFGKPSAQKVSSQGSVPLMTNKTANGFSISGVAAKGESLLAQDAEYPITDSKDGEKTFRRLYVPAARLVADGSKQNARLTLDLVPTGVQDASGMEVQAFYKGKPLPKAKVEVVAASGWGKEFRADDEGKLTFKMPWQGSYVLELKHADSTAGERGADKYDRASYATSLTVMQANGMTALPAPGISIPNTMK